MRATRLLLPAALLLSPVAAATADRTVAVTSFVRLRVEGPYRVEVRTGVSPAARISGDAAAVERVDVVQTGDTLVVRAGAGEWGERAAATPRRAAGPLTVTLGTPRLAGVAVAGGAEVRAGTLTGARADLSVTGAGRLAVERVEVERLVATVVGAGTLSVAGKATGARLSVSGAGAIAAPELVAADLVVRVEGAGEIAAGARYTAQVTATGLGRATVLGTPKCQVRAPAGAAVTCGTDDRPGRPR